MAKLQVCGGFDGSESNDHTVIRLETIDGWQFTPRYGPDKRLCHWDPAEWSGKVPRSEINVAMAELQERYDIERLYCDPWGWRTEIETWANLYGDKHVFEWDTGRGQARFGAVHAALERFLDDLLHDSLTHDNCAVTAVHVANARKIARPGQRYTIGKPGNEHQKIDAAMSSVLCHEAACDARAAGWEVRVEAKTVVMR